MTPVIVMVLGGGALAIGIAVAGKRRRPTLMDRLTVPSPSHARQKQPPRAHTPGPRLQLFCPLGP